jgi:hypothetical protein
VDFGNYCDVTNKIYCITRYDSQSISFTLPNALSEWTIEFWVYANGANQVLFNSASFANIYSFNSHIIKVQ